MADQIQDEDDLRGMLPSEILAVVQRLQRELAIADGVENALVVANERLTEERDGYRTQVRLLRDVLVLVSGCAFCAACAQVADDTLRLVERMESYEAASGRDLPVQGA